VKPGKTENNNLPQAAPFTISRVLDAPRDLVFQVHTDPRHLAEWLSPEGFHNIHSAVDFRPGGTYHYGLEGPGGARMWGRQTYREIVPGAKLVYIQSFSDEEGGLARHPMAAAWPLEMLATVRFEDAGPGKTRVSLSWHPHESDEAGNETFDSARPGMERGFGGTFVKLEAYLARLQGR
jgi:uncharacterized protein YndB with AHSA1/START domain